MLRLRYHFVIKLSPLLYTDYYLSITLQDTSDNYQTKYLQNYFISRLTKFPQLEGVSQLPEEGTSLFIAPTSLVQITLKMCHKCFRDQISRI